MESIDIAWRFIGDFYVQDYGWPSLYRVFGLADERSSCYSIYPAFGYRIDTVLYCGDVYSNPVPSLCYLRAI
jgi:hypothetical protein